MEESNLVRCDSLDAGSGCGEEEEEVIPIDLMTFEPMGADPVATFEPVGADPAATSEPSPAELAQCQAEMGTLLSIIAALNRKMGALKAPSDPEDPTQPGPARPPDPGLLTRGPDRSPAAAATSEPPAAGRAGGSGEVWTDLLGVLSAVEGTITSRRAWAGPTTACDRDRQAEHLSAARDSWVRATQVLEEMERELGISYPSGLPAEERQGYQRDTLALHQLNVTLTGTLRVRQDELREARGTVAQMEEERSQLQEKLAGLHQVWRSGSLSPPYSPTGSSGGGALSPGWASPPLFPGSPLLLRRRAGTFSPLAPSGDLSPSAYLGSPCPSPCPSPTPSPCPSPSAMVSLESETERLQRCIERLKARNERLSAALERRKGESEQVSMTLSRHEADGSALQMALRYCEECEEVYTDLLSLYAERKQEGIPLWSDPAEPTSDWQPGSPRPQIRNLRTEELSTSFSTAGGTVERETLSHTSQRSQLMEREVGLRQQIELLKRDRSAVCLPRPGPGGEGKLSPDTGTLAGPRGGPRTRDQAVPGNTKREKAALLYELVSVREEMSELRGLIRLTEKERRCLDWSLMAQKAQDAAGALISESLGEELEERRTESRQEGAEERRTEQQRLAENVAKLASEGDVVPGPRGRTLLRELQATLQREQVMKRRASVVRDSLDMSLSDSASRRRDSEEQVARLAQAHSKAVGSYRNARKKHREQLWRVEQKAAAMSERHHSQMGALRATLEALEWRREETVL